ncbi:hypothetical protein [Shimia sp.]|uniref:hypothetical protein n=1 Tax=Shimia sp. TaxID=1954381 RepID=UPI003298677E
MNYRVVLFAIAFAQPVAAEERRVYLETDDGTRIDVAQVTVTENGQFAVEMNDASFTDHFLSMRPFKCIEGPDKHWCHVPYPYENRRNISADLTDLEYDFLFLWKDSTEYGIDMWNGVYYKLSQDGNGLTGILHEMDMNTLSAPPDPGDLRPIAAKHLHESDPDSHWLPRLIID